MLGAQFTGDAGKFGNGGIQHFGCFLMGTTLPHFAPDEECKSVAVESAILFHGMIGERRAIVIRGVIRGQGQALAREDGWVWGGSG